VIRVEFLITQNQMIEALDTALPRTGNARLSCITNSGGPSTFYRIT
jgi:hypothetical protein